MKRRAFAFGSVTRNDFNESSDIDLGVDFEEKDPFKYTDLYFSLKSKLEEILKDKLIYLKREQSETKYSDSSWKIPK